MYMEVVCLGLGGTLTSCVNTCSQFWKSYTTFIIIQNVFSFNFCNVIVRTYFTVSMSFNVARGQVDKA